MFSMKNKNETAKILVIYDSLYGNTEKIARAVAAGFRETQSVTVLNTQEVTLTDLDALDLLTVGSPTQGGRAKADLKTFLDTIPEGILKGVSCAVFDTRFAEKDQKFALRLLMKTIGYAAPKIATILKQKGGNLCVSPEGFIVTETKGPLKKGEIERATAWGASLFTFEKERKTK